MKSLILEEYYTRTTSSQTLCKTNCLAKKTCMRRTNATVFNSSMIADTTGTGRQILLVCRKSIKHNSPNRLGNPMKMGDPLNVYSMCRKPVHFPAVLFIFMFTYF